MPQGFKHINTGTYKPQQTHELGRTEENRSVSLMTDREELFVEHYPILYSTTII